MIHADTSAPLLQVRDLDVIFDTHRGPVQVLHQVSFDIAAGEILGVVGESGAGKSMTGHAITGLIEPPGRVAGGTITFEGRRIDTLRGEPLRQLRGRQIGMIFQDPLTSLNPVYTIGQHLVETIRTHLPVSVQEARTRAIALLDEVEISGAARRLDQYPHQFSGGMRQRVAIALALCAEPRLLIADEPTTALDVSVQAQVIRLLRRLCHERQLAAMLITHDMGVIADIADRVMVMLAGRVQETGPVRQVLEHPEKPYTRMLMAAIPSVTERPNRLPLPDDGASPVSTGSPSISPSIRVSVETPAGATVVAPSENSDGSIATTRSDGAPRPDTPLLRVQGLSRRFDLSSGWLDRLLSRQPHIVQAVDQVSFDIPRGHTFGLVGESGSGKSTVARMVAGLLKPDAGRVIFDGITRFGEGAQALGAEQQRALRRRCQMIFQDPYASLNPRWPVLRLVAEPLHAEGLMPGADKLSTAEVEARVIDMLRRVRLSPDDARKYPHQFSGGQRQRIAIARALINQPDFIICDEPTSALDVSVQAQVLNLMRDLQDEMGLTYLLISHNLAVIRFMCDDIGVMKQGRMVEQGAADAVLDAPQHDYTRELLAAVPSLTPLPA